MKFVHPLRLIVCLSILVFSQLSYGQRAISEKVNENLNQIRQTVQKIPLQTVSEDLLKTPIDESILSHKQILQINSTQVQSIKNENSEYLRMSLPIEGQDVELELYKANIFTENFHAELSSEPGKNMKMQRGLHYWGIIADEPNSLATISFVGDEIVGGIYYDDKQMSLTKLRNSDYHVMFANKDFNHTLDFECQALPIDGVDFSLETNEAVEKSGSLLDCVGIHVEVDRTVYQDNGNSVANTTNYVNALFAQVAALYANESIAVAISFLRVWNTADPYGNGTELDDLRNQGYGTTNGNLVHLLHANGGGGVAYLNGLCDNTFNVGVSNIFSTFSNVPTYSWDVEVFAHEIGHNLGSPHTHACAWNGNNTAIDGCGPSSGNDEGCNASLPTNGGTVMSYCHLVGGVGINFNFGFGPQPGDLIRAFTASRNCGDFCTVVCPAQVNTPYSRTEDVCAGTTIYTLPTSYTGLVLDDNSAAQYEWSTGNYISTGGTPYTGTTYTLTNPSGCNPVIERLYLNVGCSSGGLNDIDAGILTLNVYPDPAQFTANDLVTVSGQNSCGEPVISANCSGVSVTPDAANPTFPVFGGQSGTANYTITYTSPAGAPDCCAVDANGELITNGDFEAGATGWTETEEVPTGTPNPNPFGIIGVSNSPINGTNDAWFGGWGNTSTLTISQNITIPATCSQANLTFDFLMSCAGDAGITLDVAINGVVLGTLSCTDNSSGSITAFDLIAAGAPTGNVTISFIGIEDGTGTGEPDIYIDNVSVVTAGCSAPTVCEIPVSATYDCQQTCAGVDLNINFDGFPSQTSWEITDTNTGGTVITGGTYGGQAGNSNLSLSNVSCLPDGCYELTFYDALNNGMCPFRASASSSGTFITPGTLISAGSTVATLGTVVSPGLCGNYTLTDANGTTLASGGGSFGAQQSNTFCLTGGTASFWQPDGSEAYAKQEQSSSELKVFPTLTNDYLFVFASKIEQGQINILDMNGQIIQQYPQNTSQMQLNVSNLPAGIYFLQIVAGDTVLVEKFVKQ